MKKTILSIMVIILASCNFSANVKKENNIQDKEEAESVIATLYLKTKRKEFDSIPKLMSEGFLKISSEKDMINFLLIKQNKMGDFIDFKLINWKTIDMNGTDSKTEYLLHYETNYKNGKAEEIIQLVKENKKIKLFGYRVDSPLISK